MANREYWDACNFRKVTGPCDKGFYKTNALHREDRNPSLSVQPDDGDTAGYFRDFATGEEGTLFEYCKMLGRVVRSKPMGKPAKPKPLALAEWAKRRRISPGTIELFGVVEERLGSIRYPTPIGIDRIKGINEGKSTHRWAKSGGGACAYGLEQSAGLDGPIYLVEGEPSVWACVQSGVPAVCSLVGATGSVEPLVGALAGRSVRIAYDADEPGRKGAASALAVLSAAGIDAQIVTLPSTVVGYDVDDLHREVGDAALRGALEALENSKPDLPPKYDIGSDGELIRLKGDTPVFVAECPIRVTHVGVDVDDGHHMWRIAWRDQHLDVPRDALAQSREIVKQSAWGLPVDQTTAGELVKYLSEYERHARDEIERRDTASATGWHGDSYLRGAHRHGDDCPHNHVDPGSRQWIEAIKTCGSADEWDRTIQRAIAHPVVRLLVAASVVSAVTQRIGAPASVIDVAGTTSQGKTSALLVALSAIGDPEALLRTWDTTRIAVERQAAIARGLTLAYDDTTRTNRISDIAGVCYDVVSGISRARADRSGGLRPQPPTHSWILSTGEGPLADLAPGLGGLRARVLSVRQETWGTTSKEVGAEVRATVAECHEHYGHALARVVEYLRTLTVRQLRAAWAQRVKAASDEIYAAHPTHVAGDRIAQAIGSLRTAGAVLEQCTGLRADDWVEGSVAREIWAGSATADRALAALDEVISAVSVAEQRIEIRPPGKRAAGGIPQQPPTLGWIGRGDRDDGGDWCDLCLDPGWVRDALRRAGYEPTTVIASWASRGWLVMDGDRTTIKRSVGRSNPRLIVFTEAALARG